MTDRLTFDEDQHRYFLDGREIGSVTTILSGVGLKKTDFGPDGDWYARRGTMVHKACHYLDQGVLDWNTVDERIVGYVRAWEDWKEFTGVEIVKSEGKVFSETWWYAGTEDKVVRGFLGSLDDMGLDLKTGAPDAADQLQTAGYVMARCPSDYFNKKRAALYLKEDGKWELKPHEERGDFNIFQSAVNLYNYKGKIK